MLRDVEFQRVYTPSELARLKQFIEDSKKPLYPDCQKYSHLFGDLKLLLLKVDHGWGNKSGDAGSQNASLMLISQ
jgi:hypothetical protein